MPDVFRRNVDLATLQLGQTATSIRENYALVAKSRDLSEDSRGLLRRLQADDQWRRRMYEFLPNRTDAPKTGSRH